MTNTMTNKDKIKELLGHAEALQDYCMKNNSCDGCPFNRYYGCLFFDAGNGKTPDWWNMDELKEEYGVDEI